MGAGGPFVNLRVVSLDSSLPEGCPEGCPEEKCDPINISLDASYRSPYDILVGGSDEAFLLEILEELVAPHNLVLSYISMLALRFNLPQVVLLTWNRAQAEEWQLPSTAPELTIARDQGEYGGEVGILLAFTRAMLCAEIDSLVNAVKALLKDFPYAPPPATASVAAAAGAPQGAGKSADKSDGGADDEGSVANQGLRLSGLRPLEFATTLSSHFTSPPPVWWPSSQIPWAESSKQSLASPIALPMCCLAVELFHNHHQAAPFLQPPSNFGSCSETPSSSLRGGLGIVSRSAKPGVSKHAPLLQKHDPVMAATTPVLAPMAPPLSPKLSRLVALSFRGRGDVADEHICNVVKSCPGLLRLALDDCTGLVCPLPLLLSLDPQPKATSEVAALSAAEAPPPLSSEESPVLPLTHGLREISLHGCWRLSDTFVDTLIALVATNKEKGDCYRQRLSNLTISSSGGSSCAHTEFPSLSWSDLSVNPPDTRDAVIGSRGDGDRVVRVVILSSEFSGAWVSVDPRIQDGYGALPNVGRDFHIRRRDGVEVSAKESLEASLNRYTITVAPTFKYNNAVGFAGRMARGVRRQHLRFAVASPSTMIEGKVCPRHLGINMIDAAAAQCLLKI
jgi:hypothetical protein